MTDFGSDFAGIGDFDSALSIVEGERCLAEALANRLMARQGTLLGNPAYGGNLNDLLNESMGDEEIEAGRKRIEHTCLQDERVDGCVAASAFDQPTGALASDVGIDTADGPFRFTLVASPSKYDVLFGNNP